MALVAPKSTDCLCCSDVPEEDGAVAADAGEGGVVGGDTDVEALEREHRTPTLHELRICVTGFENRLCCLIFDRYQIC